MQYTIEKIRKWWSTVKINEHYLEIEEQDEELAEEICKLEDVEMHDGIELSEGPDGKVLLSVVYHDGGFYLDVEFK